MFDAHCVGMCRSVCFRKDIRARSRNARCRRTASGSITFHLPQNSGRPHNHALKIFCIAEGPGSIVGTPRELQPRTRSTEGDRFFRCAHVKRSFRMPRMKIQVNSDKTIDVDANLTRSIEDEVTRVLGRFATKLTRVEIHLSDVDKKKMGQADKRCLIEVRPMGARPLTASARDTKMSTSISGALAKMQRSLTTFFGRRGRPAAEISAPVLVAEKTLTRKTTLGAEKKTTVNKAPVEKPAKLSPRGPKGKGIYQARRKSWPTR
jgi:ribosome-associated translation inhibitor RaiA